MFLFKFILNSHLQGGGFMDMFGMMEEMMGNVVSIMQILIILQIKHAFKCLKSVFLYVVFVSRKE